MPGSVEGFRFGRPLFFRVCTVGTSATCKPASAYFTDGNISLKSKAEEFRQHAIACLESAKRMSGAKIASA